MKNRLYMLTLLLCCSLFFYGCDSAEKGGAQQSQAEEQKETVQAPPFNADSAYAFVAKQVAFGPRVPNTAWMSSHGTSLAGTTLISPVIRSRPPSGRPSA